MILRPADQTVQPVELFLLFVQRFQLLAAAEPEAAQQILRRARAAERLRPRDLGVAAAGVLHARADAVPVVHRELLSVSLMPV